MIPKTSFRILFAYLQLCVLPSHFLTCIGFRHCPPHLISHIRMFARMRVTSVRSGPGLDSVRVLPLVPCPDPLLSSTSSTSTTSLRPSECCSSPSSFWPTHHDMMIRKCLIVLRSYPLFAHGDLKDGLNVHPSVYAMDVYPCIHAPTSHVCASTFRVWTCHAGTCYELRPCTTVAAPPYRNT